MTYFLQDGNDVVLVINLLNNLVEENEQLKQQVEYSANVNNLLITEFINQIGQATGQTKVALMELTKKEFVLEFPTKEFKRLQEHNKHLQHELNAQKSLCNYYRNKYNKLLDNIQNVKGELVIK